MKIRRLRHIPLLILLCVLMSGAVGCLYYNTFFNAKQAFNDAEKQRKSKGVGSAGGYQTAIDKALKVVENHPKSKYYDDALYVLGVSYFYTNQPLKAERRCRELLANYPNSKYVKEMTLYLARAKLKLKEEDEAFKIFEEIFEGKYNKDYRAEAALELGQYQKEEKNYLEAERFFQAVRDSLGNDRQQLDAQKLLAENYFDAYKFAEALSGYLQVLGMNPDKNEKYVALYRAALCSYRLQRIPVGMDYLGKLIKDPLYYDSVSALQLTIGQGYEYSGDLAQAEATYEEIATTSTSQTRTGEAFYRLGLIYQFDYDDLIKAKQYYDQAAKASGSTESGKDALQRASDIARMQSLSQSAEEALDEELKAMKEKEAKDSLSDSSAAEAVDSLGRAVVETTSALVDTAKLNAERTAAPVTDSLKNDSAKTTAAVTDSLISDSVKTSELAVRDSTAGDSTVTVPDSTAAKQDSGAVITAKSAAPAIGDTATKLADTVQPQPPISPEGVNPNQLKALVDSIGRVTESLQTIARLDSARTAQDSGLVRPDTTQSTVAAIADSGNPKPVTTTHAALGSKHATDSALITKAEADSIAAARKAAADTLAAKRAVQKRIDDAGKTLFQLAELYWFQLDKPDSAIDQLKFLLEHYPTSAIAPSALISLAQMHRDYLADSLGGDSLLHELLKRYPRSDKVPQALAELNMLGSPADTGYAPFYYNKAEDFLIDSSNVDSALHYYQYVVDHFQESPLYEQARFAIIWVNENYRSPGDSSIAIAYKNFADSFPGTALAQEATKRITYRPPERRAAKGGKDDSTHVAGDSAKASEAVVLQPDNPDSLAASTYLDPREKARIGPNGEDLVQLDINPVVTNIEFDFPAEGYAEQQDEFQMYFQILLDFSGKVIDYALKVPCQVEEINKRATRSVSSMEFDPLAVNKELTSKSTELILSEDKTDPRGRWYLFKYTVEKPGHAK